MSNPAARDIDPVPSLRSTVTVHVVGGAAARVRRPPRSPYPSSRAPAHRPTSGRTGAQLAAVGFTGCRRPGRRPPGPRTAAPSSRSASATRAPSTRRGSATSRRTSRVPCRSTPPWPSSSPDRELALSPAAFAQAVVEGVLLARWRFFVGAGGDEPTLDLADHRDRRAGGGRGPRRRRARSGRSPAPPRSAATCPTAPPPPSRPSAWPRWRSEVGTAGRPRGRGLRPAAAAGDGLRRHPRRQPGQRRGAPAHQGVATGPTPRPGPWAWSARGSCTTRAGSASSRATSPTRR